MSIERKFTRRAYLDAVEQRVIIFDGAMGTSLQKYELVDADYGGKQYFGCVDYLIISKPEVVEGVHRSFLDVGVDVIETNTFRSGSIFQTKETSSVVNNDANTGHKTIQIHIDRQDRNSRLLTVLDSFPSAHLPSIRFGRGR